MRKIEIEERLCERGGERERERVERDLAKERERERGGGGERFREHGMEIAKGTKILRKSELYTDIDISGKNINSQRTGVKKRKRERNREK